MIPPPPVYRYAPVILVVTVSMATYWIASSIEKNMPAPSSLGRIIEEARRAAGDVKQTLKKTRALTSAKLARRPRKATPEPAQQSPGRKSFSLLGEGRISRLGVIKSSGVIADFSSYEDADNEKLKLLKLSVRDMGGGKNDERFASGVIDFTKPVDARGLQTITIKLKGKGVKGFGLAALSKKGTLLFRWDVNYNSGFYKLGAYSFQFNSFDLWEYDTITRKYTRMKKGPLPEKIDQIQIYLKAGHLADAKSGELRIQSLTLQGDK